MGDKLAIKKTWLEARKDMGKSSPSGALSSEPSRKKRLPEGVESHLRKLWKDNHGCNTIGSWLCNEEVMSAIYFAWIDTPKALNIPDHASVTKRSTLTQRVLSRGL